MNINDSKDFNIEKIENKELCSFIIDTYIHDVNLSSKVNDKLKSLNLSPDADKIYSIDVYFDKKVYGEVEFYSFPLERKQWQIEKLEKLDTREKQKTIIGQVLSAQLQNVCNEIRKFNFTCRNIRIIGDELGDLNQVKIKITEDNVTKQRESIEASSKKSKKNNTIHTVATIVPDQPYIVEKAAEVIADLFLRKIKEEGLKEFEKSKHTPNLISTKQVFNSLANALITEFPDKYTSPELMVKAEKQD